MSSSATGKTSKGTSQSVTDSKGKGLARTIDENRPTEDDEMLEEDEDDDDDEEEDGDEDMDEDDIVEDDYEEIDPSVIKSRRTRGKRVDYTSKEALDKAGLKPEEEDDE